MLPDLKIMSFSLRRGPLQATRYGNYAMNQPNKKQFATHDIKHGRCEHKGKGQYNS